MYKTDDPIIDSIRYDAELEERKQTLPMCEECREHIMDDGAYYINDNWYCKKCIDKHWKWLD